MFQVSTCSPPGQRESGSRARVIPQTPARAPLGYRFDPSPANVLDLIRDGKLLPLDDQVLKVLLRFRDRLRFSAWSSNGTIASKIGRSVRTVQLSLSRLEAAGLIARERLDVPDPDDPRNRTGRRVVFLWLAPDGYQPRPGPDRRPPAERRVWVRFDAPPVPPDATDPSPAPGTATAPELPPPPPAGTAVSSPRMNSVSSPETQSVSFRVMNSVSSNSEGFPTQEGISSSSDDEPEARDDDESRLRVGERERAVEAAREQLGAEIARTIEADAGRIGSRLGGRWDLLLAAVFMAATARKPIARLLPWLIAVALDFRKHGVSAEAREAQVRHEARAAAVLDRIVRDLGARGLQLRLAAGGAKLALVDPATGRPAEAGGLSASLWDDLLKHRDALLARVKAGGPLPPVAPRPAGPRSVAPCHVSEAVPGPQAREQVLAEIGALRGQAEALGCGPGWAAMRRLIELRVADLEARPPAASAGGGPTGAGRCPGPDNGSES